MLAKAFNFSYPIALVSTTAAILFYAKANQLRPGVELLIFSFGFFLLVVVVCMIPALAFLAARRKKPEKT